MLLIRLILEFLRIGIFFILFGILVNLTVAWPLFSLFPDERENPYFTIPIGVLTLVITFVWYRLRGQYTGWYRPK